MTAAFKPGREARKPSPPSPLLAFLAGEHAEAMARLWPAPHEGFFALPAARRHAAAMLAGRAPDEAVRAGVSRGRDSQVARSLVADGPTAGLMKALGRMGERLWPAEDYGAFGKLFVEPNANRVLRHLAELTPARLAPLSALPPVLREAAIVAHAPDAAAAADLALAFDLAARVKQARAAELAARWRRADSAERLFAMAAEDLQPDVFAPRPPPPRLPAPFEAVTTRKQLHRVAAAFRNCLRDFAYDLASGRMAVYVWRGAPNAALALTCDAAGWRLAEAEAANNTPLAEGALREIAAAVLAAGARTGPSLETLGRRLYDHPRQRDRDFETRISWVERLELGDLWN